MPINPPGKPPGSYGPPPPESGCLMGIFELIWKLIVVAIVIFIIAYIVGPIIGISFPQ